jgi:hypothetical protein
MLRLPVKILLIVAGLVAIFLGLHSIWVFMNVPSFGRMFANAFAGSTTIITEKGLMALQGTPYVKLFMFIELPLKMQYPVVMASALGAKSWFGGAFLIGVGIGLLYLNNQIYYKGSNILRKLHLW